jgi:hypothetical protein
LIKYLFPGGFGVYLLTITGLLTWVIKIVNGPDDLVQVTGHYSCSVVALFTPCSRIIHVTKVMTEI